VSERRGVAALPWLVVMQQRLIVRIRELPRDALGTVR
jgi:hypothetical protein